MPRSFTTATLLLVGFCTLQSVSSNADDAVIKFVEMQRQGANWRANVTLLHPDHGMVHYADAWRIVTADGRVAGNRVLSHPHENEQPFTRGLAGINIPPEATVVFVEAHCSRDGWSKDRVEIRLTDSKGDRFKIIQ